MNPIKRLKAYDGLLSAKGKIVDRWEAHALACGLGDGAGDAEYAPQQNRFTKKETWYYKAGYYFGKHDNVTKTGIGAVIGQIPHAAPYLNGVV